LIKNKFDAWFHRRLQCGQRHGNPIENERIIPASPGVEHGSGAKPGTTTSSQQPFSHVVCCPGMLLGKQLLKKILRNCISVGAASFSNLSKPARLA
jgi:hypothetical protein